MKKNTKIALPFIALALLSGCSSIENKDLRTEVPQKTSPVPPQYAQKQLTGTWHIEYIQDKPVIDRSPARLVFQNKSKLSGSASCNNIHASYQKNNNQLSIDKTAITRKMCPEALMEQEQRFLAALSQINHYKIERGLLYLFDAQNNLMLKAAK